MEFYATCPKGFERLLADELSALSTPRVRPLQGRVSFEGELADGLRVCLWSRLASRVICVLTRGGARDSDELFETASQVSWQDHVRQGSVVSVSASGTNARLTDSRYSALRVKDAISDTLLARRGERLNTSRTAPDLTVTASISGERVAIGIDLAGAPLTNRGYERARDTSGLRADYACALLALGGWPLKGEDSVPVLLDASSYPTCLIVEAALAAADRAPGLLRLRWGFTGWGTHDADVWERLVTEATARAHESCPARLLVDAHTRGAASRLTQTLRAAGIEATVETLDEGNAPRADLVAADLSSLFADDVVQEASTLSRLTRVADLTQPSSIICAARDKLVATSLGREVTNKIDSRLGQAPLHLLALGEQTARRETVKLASGVEVPVLVGASDQFARRLERVVRLREKWARREDVTCYRVYDADLPDYALTIDLFQGSNPDTGEPDGRKWLWVSEYAAPRGIDPTIARARLTDALAIAPEVMGVRARDTFLRVRRHDKGGSQYAHEGRQKKDQRNTKRTLPPGAHLIDEGGLAFEVNFETRLDCGIFLDHRETRSMLREMMKETKGSRRFLNLFAYTGTATCYAADGGARHTTTVDLSRPSLDWARRNMERNGFSGREHEYVQADVQRWVGEQRHTKNRWDLVFCDVPTFSNSSRMGRRSFDVQRDHAELLISVSRLLTREGRCVFSCNLRTFSPDVDKLARAGVEIEDITDQTIPEDFSRNKRIHHAYIVRRTPRTEA